MPDDQSVIITALLKKFRNSQAQLDEINVVIRNIIADAKKTPIPKDGLSAYQIWLKTNKGTEKDFIESLRGKDGDSIKGDPGLSIQGDKGDPGLSIRGKKGKPGDNGLSAYEIWKLEGNKGSKKKFLESLKGEKGDFVKGDPGVDGISIDDAFINSNGHLIIVFSNGYEKDVGKVTGEEIVKIVRTFGGGGGISQSDLDAAILAATTNLTINNFVDSGVAQWTNDAGYIISINWGDIGGTLSNQVDLQAALDAKLPTSVTTTDIEEGSNLYFTDERAQDAVGLMVAGNTETLITVTYDDNTAKLNFVVDEAGIDHGSIAGLEGDDHTQYHNDGRALTWLGTRSTTDIPEGGNQYYTDVKVDSRITLQSGTANGLAPLGADSKIPTSYLPAIALTDVFVVNSQAAQLALAAEEGDVAVRTDLNKSYIHNGGTAGTMADWQELLTPTDAVLSVNGFTGAVTLTTANITENTNLYYTNVRADARIAAAVGVTVQPLDADLTALAALATTGIMSRTAANTYALRTLTGTSNRIVITSGDGVSGNPTIDISSAYAGQSTITNVGTITTGAWNAGAITSSGNILSNANNMKVTASNSGGEQLVLAENNNNSNTDSHSVFRATVGGTSGGDPKLVFLTPSIGSWSYGSDTSDSQKLKEGFSNEVGTDTTRIVTRAGEQTMPLQPSFLAYLGSNVTNVTGNGASFTLGNTTALTEVFDQNGDFNPTGGTFTAPVTGRYPFSGAFIATGCSAASYTDIRLVTSNRTYVFQQSQRLASSDNFGLCGSVLADMDAGDTANLTILVTGEVANTVDIQGGSLLVSYFSGNLAC